MFTNKWHKKDKNNFMTKCTKCSKNVTRDFLMSNMKDVFLKIN